MDILIASTSSSLMLLMVPVWELSTCSIATYQHPRYRPSCRPLRVSPSTPTFQFSVLWLEIRAYFKKKLREWSQFLSRRGLDVSNLGQIGLTKSRKTSIQLIYSMAYSSQLAIHTLKHRTHQDRCLIRLRKLVTVIMVNRVGKLRGKKDLGLQESLFQILMMIPGVLSLKISVLFNS